MAATLISRRARDVAEALIFPVGQIPAAIRSAPPRPAATVQLLLRGSQPGMITRPPAAWTRPSRRSTASAVTTTVRHTTGSPVVIGEVPATSSADRPSPPKSARTGRPAPTPARPPPPPGEPLVHSGTSTPAFAGRDGTA